MFHYGTVITRSIKGFRYKSIAIRRLSYSDQTLTIGDVTVVVSGPRVSITVSYRNAYELGWISEVNM